MVSCHELCCVRKVDRIPTSERIIIFVIEFCLQEDTRERKSVGVDKFPDDIMRELQKDASSAEKVAGVIDIRIDADAVS